MENAIYKAITIYLVGVLGIWKAIPVGIALKSSIFEIGLYTSLGSITTVILLFYFGESVKKWVTKKWSKEKLEKEKGKFSALVDKYGVYGVGILSPGLLGPITAIIVGLLIIKPTSKLMPFLIIGIILWSYFLPWGIMMGFDMVKSWF